MSQPQFTTGAPVAVPEKTETLTSATCPPMAVSSFGLTHPGSVRDTNQDQFLIAVLQKALSVERTSLPQVKVRHGADQSYLFIVADGMGGHAGGEQASALAIDSVESFVLDTFKWFARCKGSDQDQVLADLQKALGHANDRVRGEADERPELRGMGTTLTLAYSLNDELFVAHVGDSRCYLLRQGTLYRLTHDHTLVEEMVRRGALSAEEAATHKWRHVITNAVGGGDPGVKVEVHKLRLESGDQVLVCSDGLTKMVPEEEIARILQAEVKAEQSCRRLVACANDAGGRDNITVIVAQFRAVEERD